MDSKDFRRKNGDFILQLTSICTYRDYKNDFGMILFETILLYSRSQIKYYPSMCANINLSRYYIFNFNFFFPFNFPRVEILGSISNETREKRNGIIKRNEQKKIPQFYSYAVSIQ